MLKSMVREALVTSVTKEAPCVKRKMSQASTVPAHNLPCASSARAAGTLSSIQRILLAEK